MREGGWGKYESYILRKSLPYFYTISFHGMQRRQDHFQKNAKINKEGRMTMKLFLYIISLICIAFSEIQASEKASESAVVPKYQLSTHILDTNLGRPASDVPIVLFRLAEDGETWNKVDEGITDSNGRIASFLSA